MTIPSWLNDEQKAKRMTWNLLRALTPIVIVSALTMATSQTGFTQMINPPYPDIMQQPADREHPYVGMWVTEGEHIRHELLPGGRYDEARGERESAYQGRYEVRGNYIYYWDDTGFTADGEFIDDVLHHGGMILHRQKDASRR